MKKNQNRGQQQAGRNKKVNQCRVRARADETVIIQITDEQGREWARVPFSHLEHSALRAVCDLRGCTMKELFDLAVGEELARRTATPPPAAPPQPGGTAAASATTPAAETLGTRKPDAFPNPYGARTSRDIEHAVNQGIAMIGLFNGCLYADHLASNRRNGDTMAVGLLESADTLESWLQTAWDSAEETRQHGGDMPRKLRDMYSALRATAAYIHAATHACAERFDLCVDLPGLTVGYCELGDVWARVLLDVVPDAFGRAVCGKAEVAA